jgi:diguanylate cyclase (GGDEF)-like protein
MDMTEGSFSGVDADGLGVIEGIVSQRLDLPSPPNVAFRILEAVKDEERSLAQIGGIISKDPALTARLMKVANSSIYGLSRKVQSIEGALAVLGTNVIKNIALSFILMDGLRDPVEVLFDIELFWKRAITSAVAADTVATLLEYSSEDIFLCGLLQDIGVLVLCRHLPEEYRKVLVVKSYADSRLYPVEREILGFGHSEVGGLLLKGWGLPADIYLPIFFHHRDADRASPCHNLVAMLNMADKISALYHGTGDARTLREVYLFFEEYHQLDHRTVKSMIDEVAERTVEILAYFDIEAEDMKPLSVMLQEANRELSEMAFSYEELVRKLKWSQEESKTFIGRILDTNKELRQLAFRDELTGLYNHRFFQKEIEQELERSKRYGHALALVFFDIDYFKEINDTYGHLAGDVVLRTVAKQVRTAMRSCDIVVRYGGDEFAIIMPETSHSGLEIFAERLRSVVEDTVVEVDGQSIRITVSVGGACCRGGINTVTKFALFNAADQAIYQSKKAGRNNVTISPLV